MNKSMDEEAMKSNGRKKRELGFAKTGKKHRGPCAVSKNEQ